MSCIHDLEIGVGRRTRSRLDLIERHERILLCVDEERRIQHVRQIRCEGRTKARWRHLATMEVCEPSAVSRVTQRLVDVIEDVGFIGAHARADGSDTAKAKNTI